MSAAPGRRQMAPSAQVSSKAMRAVASATPGSASGPPRGAAGTTAAAVVWAFVGSPIGSSASERAVNAVPLS
eukprot:566142-Lingulodinium_polyedra.AAC.1